MGCFETSNAGRGSPYSVNVPDINLLARGASNAKWRSGCLAPDRYVESICDWLIRGPLFCAAAEPAGCLANSLDQVLSYCPDGGLRAVRDADLAKDVLDVFFHRLVADSQRLGDFLVRQAKRKLFQHFTFALG